MDSHALSPIYIHCAANNRASTVIAMFQEGVSRFGLPDKVRSDHGGENIDVWRYMLNSHNGDSHCVITGSSTHNERIERLWRDVHRCVAHFAETFRDLECEGVLDPLNDVDMFCLHYVFLPRINKCLLDFQESWNNHGLSTEASMTPYQLFAEGTSCAVRLDMPTATSLFSIFPSSLPDAHEAVGVPDVFFVPCQVLNSQLQQVHPCQSCSDHGKQLFGQTIRVVGQHLLSGCEECVT